MTEKTEYLDKTEAFVEWLEEKRRESGLTQAELAEEGGISHSYYTKLVSLRTLREKYGDHGRAIVAPQDPRGLYGVLDALSKRLGGHIREEGLLTWGHTGRMGPSPPHREVHRETLLGGILVTLHALPEEKLHLVAELARHLAA